MPSTDIYILSGPVHTGKTTALMQWASGRIDVHGILTPVGEDGKRFFYDLQSKVRWPMEAEVGETEILSIGKFVFSAKAFQRAIELLRSAINTDGWLVIDEIGPMELKGEGFAEVFGEILGERKGKLVVVMREGIIKDICISFQIGEFSEFRIA
ncbi:MAG: hypothetical protein IPP93_17690 [Chitinophagaceae bacterium]|nr:hypothetical protein [Chitinophagaceae bacterium]